MAPRKKARQSAQGWQLSAFRVSNIRTILVNHDLNLVHAELMIRYANKIHLAKPVQEVENAFRRKVGND
jgi:hypothetical protein